MKKIVFCDNSLKMLINFRGEIINHFHNQGYKIILVYPIQTLDNNLYKRYSYATHYPLNVAPTAISPFKDMRFTLELRNIYKKEKPSIIFHYTIKPNIYGSIASFLSGVPSIAMVAGLGYVFSGKSFLKSIGRILYRIGLRLSKSVLTLNVSNYNFLVKKKYILPSKARLLNGGEGVNLDYYSYTPKEFRETHFLMVARVLYDKGYSEFVQAASRVKEKYPNSCFELLGPLAEDNPTGVPMSVIKNDEAAGLIKYLGETNDVRPYLKRDGNVMVLLSSYPEGLNRALMEGCSMGCPCICSSIPGCKEIVDHGENGFLVEKNDAEALANQIIKFIELPQECKQKMSLASRCKASKKFDLKSVIAIYDEILNQFSL